MFTFKKLCLNKSKQWDDSLTVSQQFGHESLFWITYHLVAVSIVYSFWHTIILYVSPHLHKVCSGRHVSSHISGQHRVKRGSRGVISGCNIRETHRNVTITHIYFVLCMNTRGVDRWPENFLWDLVSPRVVLRNIRNVTSFSLCPEFANGCVKCLTGNVC